MPEPPPVTNTPTSPASAAGSLHLAIEKVSKQYGGKVWALRDFSLDLRPGVLGLLGPNGAGKTTLMSILATITLPTEGTATWNGIDIRREPDAVRQVLGFLPQDFGVYPNLNAVEFLEYLAAIKGLDAAQARRRIDELLELVNLTDARHRALGGFSGGMRQRVGIAQALLNDPRVLIVDEPTAGLDPEERVRFRNLLGDLAGERIVLLSTHIVSDVEATASRIVMMGQGRLLADAAPEALLERMRGRVWECEVAAAGVESLRASHRVGATLRRGERVLARLVSADPPAGARAVEPTLEDAYLDVQRDATAGA
jgi:ABC-type multidrug transport system ATPase subunit